MCDLESGLRTMIAGVTSGLLSTIARWPGSLSVRVQMVKSPHGLVIYTYVLHLCDEISL